MTTLEVASCVEVKRDEFFIPPDDERIKVMHTEAADYLTNNDMRRRKPLI